MIGLGSAGKYAWRIGPRSRTILTRDAYAPAAFDFRPGRLRSSPELTTSFASTEGNPGEWLHDSARCSVLLAPAGQLFELLTQCQSELIRPV